MTKECNSSPNGSAICGGKSLKRSGTTPFQISGNLKDWDEALDQPLKDIEMEFEYDSTSEHVPTGVAMLRFATLLQALDWHMYSTGDITSEYAREKIKWASELMDKKFDIEYKRLPQ